MINQRKSIVSLRAAEIRGLFSPLFPRRRYAFTDTKLQVFLCKCSKPATLDAIDMHDSRMRERFAFLDQIRKTRGQWRNIFIIDLGEVAEYDNFGVCANASNDRFQLELRKPLRFVDDNISVVKRATAHEI